MPMVNELENPHLSINYEKNDVVLTTEAKINVINKNVLFYLNPYQFFLGLVTLYKTALHQITVSLVIPDTKYFNITPIQFHHS